MKKLMNIFNALAGLFVDDGWFALAISGIVALAAIIAAILPATPMAAGIVLLAGCLGLLFSNVISAGSRARS